MKKRIIRDGSNLITGQVGTVIIGLLNMVILTRVLSTEQMGTYSLFLMVVNLILILGLNWSDASVVRHGREEFVRYKKVNQSFWARLMLYVPVVIVSSLLMIIFARPISGYIGVPQWMIVLVIALFIVNSLVKYFMKILQSVDLMKRSAYVNFFQKLFYMIGLGLVYFGYIHGDITTIILLFNLSFILVLLYNIFLFDFKLILPYKFNPEYFKRIWSYSWPQLIGFGGLYIINYIDLYVIRRYMGLSDVGIYSIAYSGFSIICGFIMLLNTLFMPLIVEYRANKKYGMIRSYLYRLPLFALIWGIAVYIGTYLSRFVIPIVFSQKYVDSIPSFNILLYASIFYFISIYLLPIVNAFDFIIYSQIFNIIKSVANIIFDFMLVPTMGIAGAAYGTLISYAVGMTLTVMLVYFKHKRITG